MRFDYKHDRVTAYGSGDIEVQNLSLDSRETRETHLPLSTPPKVGKSIYVAPLRPKRTIAR